MRRLLPLALALTLAACAGPGAASARPACPPPAAAAVDTALVPLTGSATAGQLLIRARSIAGVPVREARATIERDGIMRRSFSIGGDVLFEQVAAGRYLLTISAKDHGARTDSIEVAAAAGTAVQVPLAPACTAP